MDELIKHKFERVENKIKWDTFSSIFISFTLFTFLFLTWIQDTIHIQQIFDILHTQFPDQELYSIIDYVKHKDTLNKVLYIICIAMAIILPFGFAIFQYNMRKYYRALEAQIDSKIDQLLAAHPMQLPAAIDNERAQKYLKRALDKGLLYTQGDKLKRVDKNCTKSQLAYLLRLIYCPNFNEPLPEQALNLYFEESRLSEAILKLNKNHNFKPAHPEEIDSLFADNEHFK